jgi:hypothetical protein
LDPQDVVSISSLRNKICNELSAREDFDKESKEELIKILDGYIYNYIMMGVFYSKVTEP